MRSTPAFTIPPALGFQIVKRYLVVFASAFLTAIAAGLFNVTSVPTLKALIWTSSAAGIAAVIHVITAIQAPDPNADSLALNPKLQTALYTISITALVTFVSIFGTALVTGASHLTNLPKLFDLITAAIAAGVAGVVQYLSDFLPAGKKNASNQSGGVWESGHGRP